MESESDGVVQSLELKPSGEDEPGSSSLTAETEQDNTSHPEDTSQKNTPQTGGQGQPLCRFFSQGRRCYYGKKCRFLHQRAVATGVKQAESSVDPKTDHKEKEENANSQPSDPQQESSESTQSDKEKLPAPSSHKSAPEKRERARRPCRYFLSGFCSMDDRCRFRHPQQLPPVEDQPYGPRERRGFRPSAPAARPAHDQVKLANLTEEVCKQLRATEIAQLMKRFPKDKLIVQEREDGKLTYYRVTVQATDPEWNTKVDILKKTILDPIDFPYGHKTTATFLKISSFVFPKGKKRSGFPFDLNEVDIMVSFPENYPQEVFTLDVPEDQNLPALMARHVQKASEEWLKAKHATNQLMGRVEMLFRPYLRWLDRSMEKIFTDGARQLKKDIDLQRSGIQFVPYEQLKVTVFKNTGKKTDTPDRVVSLTAASAEEEEEEHDEAVVEEEDTAFGSDGEAGNRQVENIKTRERRKGNEIKLLGLRLGEQTATVTARQVTVSLQCSRCKVSADLTLNERLPCTAQCEKCGAEIRSAFRSSILHHYSDVLGYLDLNAAVPVDLILQESEFSVGCLNCNKEDTIQNLTYGQNWEQNCQHCHTQLSIFVEAARFQFIQPEARKTTGATAQYTQRYRDPAVQQGKPLPDKGACRHYRQSHRWLRFPCCGRAYACDACHDEDQDHLMELATRMICGYCAKEQPYSKGKPCVSCGGMMTRDTHTSHWEGGMGCRNRVKMSRNDKHKYSNMSKTVSKKTTQEK